MLPLRLAEGINGDFSLLVLGAHSDDIEIGCGGTILKLLERDSSFRVFWVVLGANGDRRREAHMSADDFLKNVNQKNIIIKSFRDSFFPYIGSEIKEYFEVLKKQVSPDLILTHSREDLHQDHRLVSELTWNSFRDHLILEYEIPKYDGDLGQRNLYVHVDEQICRMKIGKILKHFVSQRDQHWFTDDTFLSIMRLRGIESNSPSGYAEAFLCRKLALDC